MPRAKITPEAKLAAYWKRRTKLETSAFDVFQDSNFPTALTGRSPRIVVTEARLRAGEIGFDYAVAAIANFIFFGCPLGEFEYHLAVAGGLLLADGVAYEEFFKHHWFEDQDRCGYGKPERKSRPAPEPASPARITVAAANAAAAAKGLIFLERPRRERGKLYQKYEVVDNATGTTIVALTLDEAWDEIARHASPAP